jgi:DNA-binding transcriptional MerR regulator
VDPHKEAALNKAPDAFRTISEVADELDLPQHVLRFWESRFPHIKPMKRGGGRRYYRPEDVDLLRGIRHLLYGDGYTIRGVQGILREQGVRFVQSVGQGHPVILPSRYKAAEAANANGGPELLPPLFGANRSEASLSSMANGEGPGGDERLGQSAPETAPQNHPRGEASQSALPLAVAAVAVASQPSGLAPEDLDRLRAALAALEACSRLLHEGGA